MAVWSRVFLPNASDHEDISITLEVTAAGHFIVPRVELSFLSCCASAGRRPLAVRVASSYLRRTIPTPRVKRLTTVCPTAIVPMQAADKRTWHVADVTWSWVSSQFIGNRLDFFMNLRGGYFGSVSFAEEEMKSCSRNSTRRFPYPDVTQRIPGRTSNAWG